MEAVRRNPAPVAVMPSPAPRQHAPEDFMLDDDLVPEEILLMDPPDVRMGANSPSEERAVYPSVDDCLASLMNLFPKIEPGYVQTLYDKHFLAQQANIVEFLVDTVLESNGNYPKLQPQVGKNKRKRERSPSEMTPGELDNKYGGNNRVPVDRVYISIR